MPGKTGGRFPSGRVWLPVLVGLLLFSCRPPPPATPPLAAELLLQEVDAASARLRDFRGSASVETSFEGRAGRASLRIRYLNPRRFRVDVHGTMFQVLAVLLIHDQRVRLYVPRENTVFEGSIGTGDARIPGLDMTLEDVHAAVTGSIGPGKYPGLPVVEYLQGGGSAAVTLEDGRLRRTLWIDTGNMTILREAAESTTGRESVVRTFGRYQRRNGIWRPGSVRITRDGLRAGSIELTYRTQSVNRGLLPADIDVRLPQSIIRRPLADAAPVLETMNEAGDP